MADLDIRKIVQLFEEQKYTLLQTYKCKIENGNIYFFHILSNTSSVSLFVFTRTPLYAPESIITRDFIWPEDTSYTNLIEGYESVDQCIDKHNIKDLEMQYDKPLSIHGDDITPLKNTCRTVYRLNKCLKGTVYKIVFPYQDRYLIHINRRGKVVVHEHQEVSQRDNGICIALTLKHFYEKREKIDKEALQVTQSMYEMIKTNQVSHRKNIGSIPVVLSKFQENIDTVLEYDQILTSRLLHYNNLLEKVSEKKEDTEYHLNILKQSERLTKEGTRLKHSFKEKTLREEIKELTEMQDDIKKALCTLRQLKRYSIAENDAVLFESVLLTRGIESYTNQLDILSKHMKSTMDAVKQ